MPAATYTNARFAVHRKPVAPRSASETTNAGTVAPSFATSYKPPCLPKYRTRAKNLQETSMRSRTAFGTPEVSQMNANTVSFATFRSTPIAQAKPAGPPHAPQAQDPPTSDGAGTRVELAKHRPIAQHIGATYHQYPSNKVGDTLLRQKAILTINSIPGLFDRLHQDLADIRTVRHTSGAATIPPNPPDDDEWQNTEEELVPATNAANEATEAGGASSTNTGERTNSDTLLMIHKMERYKDRMEGTQLHFDPAKNVRIASGALDTLKRAGLVDAAAAMLTQAEAHMVVSAEIARVEAEIADLKRRR